MDTNPISLSSDIVRDILSGKLSQVEIKIVLSEIELIEMARHELNKYEVGKFLWVREDWAEVSDWADVDPELGMFDGYIYRSDWNQEEQPKWRSAEDMPRDAARVLLRVIQVFTERRCFDPKQALKVFVKAEVLKP